MSRRLHILEEEKCFGSSKAEKDFWHLLGWTGGDGGANVPAATPAGPPEEDDEFECAVNQLNMVWEVAAGEDGKEELRPLEVR